MLLDIYKKARKFIRKSRLSYQCSFLWQYSYLVKKNLLYPVAKRIYGRSLEAQASRWNRGTARTEHKNDEPTNFLGHGSHIKTIYMWPGNIQQGLAVMNGFFLVYDQDQRFFQRSWSEASEIFDVIKTDPFFADYIHSFVWLRDLKETGDMTARRLARRLIEFWIINSSARRTRKLSGMEYPSLEWLDVVASKRLSSWTLLYDFFGASAQDSFKKIFFAGLQAEYLSLKRKFTKNFQPVNKIIVAKALLEYNVYWNYDDSFLELLLFDLSKIIQDVSNVIISDNTSARSPGKEANNFTVVAIFDFLCTFVEIRNALRQWEKSFMPYSKIEKLLFEIVFEQVQLFLQRAAIIVRFFRHSNGTLCNVRGQHQAKSFFVESPSSEKIDMALSQVEAFTEEKYAADDVLLFDGKRSSVFLDLNIYTPRNSVVDGFLGNVTNGCFNFDWSVEANNVVVGNSFMLFPPKDSTQFLFRNQHPFCEQTNPRIFYDSGSNGGVFSFNGNSRLECAANSSLSLSREIKFCPHDNLLCGVDSVSITPSSASANLGKEIEEYPDPFGFRAKDNFLCVLQFILGRNLKIIEIKNAADKSYVFYDFEKSLAGSAKKQKKKERLLFVAATDRPFYLRSSFSYNQPTISVWYTVHCGEETSLDWSLQIIK